MKVPVCGHCNSPTYVVHDTTITWYCTRCSEEVWFGMPNFDSKVIPLRLPIEDIPRDRAWMMPIIVVLSFTVWATAAYFLLR